MIIMNETNFVRRMSKGKIYKDGIWGRHSVKWINKRDKYQRIGRRYIEYTKMECQNRKLERF